MDEAADEEHQAVAEEEKRRQHGARFDNFAQFRASVGESVVFDHLVPALRFANSLLPLVVGVFQRDDAERYYERREEHEGAEQEVGCYGARRVVDLPVVQELSGQVVAQLHSTRFKLTVKKNCCDKGKIA